MRTELGRALVCLQNYNGLCEKKKNWTVRGAVQCLFPLLPRVLFFSIIQTAILRHDLASFLCTSAPSPQIIFCWEVVTVHGLIKPVCEYISALHDKVKVMMTQFDLICFCLFPCFYQERSHSIPGSKPPLMRALGAYEEYFSHHKKGVFRRKRISLASMLSWSKVLSDF